MRNGIKVGPRPPLPLSPEDNEHVTRWLRASLEWGGVYWSKYWPLGDQRFWTKQELDEFKAERLAVSVKHGLVSRSEHAPTGSGQHVDVGPSSVRSPEVQHPEPRGLQLVQARLSPQGQEALVQTREQDRQEEPMVKLKIRALCVNLGYCEGERASCFFVHWKGKKPFEDARAALDNFIDQCKVQCVEPERELPSCCKAVLARNPKAKGCETCGELGKRRSRREHDLADMDIDGFGDKAYPCFEYPGNYDGSCRIGDWEFFQGYPTGCDVVVVNYLDKCFDDSGAMDAEYHVVHAGKAATRKSASGRIEHERH